MSRATTLFAVHGCLGLLCGCGDDLPTVDCSERSEQQIDWGTTTDEGDPLVQERFEDDDGEHVDECTTSGKLVQYYCGTYDCGNDWDYCEAYTGTVASRTVTCESGCTDGACTSP